MTNAEVAKVARPGINPGTRARVLAESDGVCVYCDTKNAVEVDHVIPWSRGGSHGMENFAPACKRCNRQKHDMTVEEWRQWRLARGQSWPPDWSEQRIASHLREFARDPEGELEWLRTLPGLSELSMDVLVKGMEALRELSRLCEETD